MTELSALGIKVTSDGVVKTTGELERFAKASNAARAAAKPVNVKVGVAGLSKAASDLQKMQTAMKAMGGQNMSDAVKMAQAISRTEIANNKAAISAQNLAAATARAEAAQNRAAASSGKVRAAVESEAAARARISQMVDRSIAQQNAEAAAVQRTGAVFNAAAGSKALAARQTRDMQQSTDLLNKSLSQTVPAANKASGSLNNLNNTVNKGVRNIQATPGNIAAQFQDIGVTAAMGMSPLLIALQQGTQLSAAFAGGGLKQLGAALKSLISPTSLLTLGIVGLIAYVIQLGFQSFTTSTKVDALREAEKKLASSIGALIASREALDKALGRNIGSYIELRSRALEAAQAELTAAQKALDAAKIRLKVAQADQKLRDDMVRADEPGSEGVAILNLFGFGSSKNIKSAANDLKDRASDLNEASATLNNATADLQKALKGENKKVDRSGHRLAERLAREAEATETLIRGNYEAAAAYRESTAAGKMAGVAAEAAAKGIKARGEAQAYAARELRKYVSEQAASAAESTASLREQTAAQEMVNKAVADGTLDIKNASIALQNMIEQRKIMNALEVARRNNDAAGEKALTIALKDLTEQQINYNAAIRAADDIAAMDNVKKSRLEATYAMDLERQGLHLVGEAAIANAWAMDKLNAEYERNGSVSAEYAATVRDQAAIFARQRYEIDRTREAIEESRDITKEFFIGWIDQVRKGDNIFKAFADSVINSLNRIIDKMMDNAWEAAFANMNGANSGGGGFLGGIVNGIAGLLGASKGPVNLLEGTPYAKGGAFANDNELTRFAKGGAFTNSIVSRPTLFQYANGGAFGEMGEAGPEAIMPLKRGPDGSLGVEAHGGRGVNNNVTVENTYNIGGVMTPEAIIAAIRQGGEETMRAVQRQLPTIMSEYDRNGAVAA